MTITEAINKLNRHKVFNADCGEAIEIVVSELLSTMAELKWYREHDLIRRRDAIREGIMVLGDLTNIDAKACKNEVEYRMKQIPKAEPPSEIKRELNETKNERNGDCETCKHYGDERHCRDCYSRYNEDPACYEPYIPKE